MAELRILPPAARFFKKLKDKQQVSGLQNKLWEASVTEEITSRYCHKVRVTL